LSRFAPLVSIAALAAVLAGCGSSSAKPAATVNGHEISMTSYKQELHYECVNADSQYGFDVCKNKTVPFLTKPIKRTALDTLIDRELIHEYARQHHISVTDAQFNRNWQIIYKSKFGTPAVLKAFAEKRYGISVAALKARVRDDLLRQQVAAYVTRNAPTRVPAIRLARLETANKGETTQVEARLKGGATFNQIATQMSKSPSNPCKTGCGDLGWIPTAFLPAYQSNLAQEKVGKVIGPLRLQKGGYEFFLVEARNQHYPLTQKQMNTMSNQVLFPRWLGQQAKKASVKRYAVT
jgi:SurA-like protein/parvulin-like peptidyl-prolyl cis-trans isomerase-like protein